jgi:pimeloyl-ACP methyl ester carboxylesterase
VKQVNHALPELATWKKFDGGGDPLHFYHANGFPLGVYSPFLSALASVFSISALENRSTWPGMGEPTKRENWQLYAADLIAFIEEHCDGPVIGLGHSMGATSTVLAARQRPDLFRALVLIEPAMVPAAVATILHHGPRRLVNNIGFIKSTWKKRDQWPDRKTFISDYRKHSLYAKFSEEGFQALHDHGVVDHDDGSVRLGFPKQWEAHNYSRAPNLMKILPDLNMPCVAVRGRPTPFFSDKLWKTWQSRCPSTLFLEDFDSGHLIPLENPLTCARLVIDGLAEVLQR